MGQPELGDAGRAAQGLCRVVHSDRRVAISNDDGIALLPISGDRCCGAQYPDLLVARLDLPIAVGRFRPEVMSPVLAMMVLIVGRQISACEAARFLGSDTSEEKWWRVLGCLRRHPLWPSMATAIVRLADFLTEHPSPIDYQRRRQLDYRDLLSADQWDAIYDQAVFGLIPSTRAAELTRSWLFERVSMQPAEVSPFAQNIHRPARRRTEVVEKFTAEVMNELDAAAADFLAGNDIFDEPVTWSPPPSIVADLELPGADPRSVSITELHEAVTGTHLPIGALARRFHVPTAVVRYLLECSPRRGRSLIVKPSSNMQARS